MENENNNLADKEIPNDAQVNPAENNQNPESQRPLLNQKNESSFGPIVSIIIIVIILSIGALYYISYIKEEIELNTENKINVEEKSVEVETEEIEVIEKELKNQETNTIEADLKEIETELEKI